MKKLLIALAIIGASVSSISKAAESSDTFDFRFSPIGLFVGSLNATLDIKVGSDWTLGPQLSYTRFKLGTSDSNFDLTGYSLGARANWFKNGAYTDGLYLGPAISYQKISGTFKNNNGSSQDVSANGPNVSLLAGYGWFWNSFNMMLGVGGQTQLGSSNITVTNSDGSQQSSNSETGITGEFSLGWTF